MLRRLISLVLSAAIVLGIPGQQAWKAAAEELSVYDAKHDKLYTAQVTNPKVKEIINKLNDPKLRERATKEQIDQMRTFLTKFKTSFKDDESPDAQAALAKLSADLDDPSKDVGLTMAQIFDHLSPQARKGSESDTVVQVLDQSGKNQTVRVTDIHTGNVLFTQNSSQIGDDVYKKIIKRTDPNTGKDVIDAIVIETKKGAATEQRVLYNRRIELLLKNLKKLYYDQPSLARKIKENCNVPDPTNHQGVAVDVRPDRRDQQMGKVACEKMVEYFDGKRANFVNATTIPEFNNINLLGYLNKLAEAAKNGTLDKLDWKELQAVQRKAMQFYNDNQLETMQKMVLIELKTYFAQVTNAQVKENKETQNLDATMKDLGELQKIFDEFKKGNFQGYSLLMTKFFAKADIEDPKYVSKDIMLLASEAFADVANAVKAQQRMLQKGLTGEELDATIEESQQWLRLAQVHLQEFDMHTLAIQLERLESGHLRDHLGLRKDDLKFLDDNGKEAVLAASENQGQALRLANIAKTQYIPQLEVINTEIKANLIKQALSGFYITYQNVSRDFFYNDTMQERVATLAAKLSEIKDLYASLVFDRAKNLPQFKGKSETEKLQGNLYELFMKSLPADFPLQYKTMQDLEALAKKFKDLSQIQSAVRVREDAKPLYDEFVRLERQVMKELTNGKTESMPIFDDVKKESQNLSIKQSKIFAAVGDFSTQARIFDMMNELDLYVCKYASSDSCYSKGDTMASKAIGMKWWDGFMSWITGGFAGHSLRDSAIDGTMKYNPLTQKAFKMLGENRQERYRIMKLMAEGKFQQAMDRIANLDKAGAERAWKEYQDDKALEDPFETLDFDSAITKTTDNKSAIMAQGVIQNMFGQLQNYIMGYTLTAAVYDTLIVSALTLGLGAVSRYAIGAAKGIVAMGEAMQVAKSAEAVGQIQKMSTIMRVLTNIGKFIINLPGKIIVYVGKWLESSMISIRNTLGISNIGKNLSMGEKAAIILREGAVNAIKFNVKNTIIMAGASAGIQSVSYAVNPQSSQFKSAGEAALQGAIQGAGFGAKSGLFILMSPVPVSAFGEGTMGNVVRGVANSPGPLSSITQGVAKVVATDSEVAAVGPLGALKEISLTASPGYYAAAKVLVWSGAMFDGALKYMLASAVAHNVASVGAYYEYKLTHSADAASGKEDMGATSEMQAIAEGESFGMTMAEMSWLLLPVHQQSNDKAVKDQIAREDGFNAAINQGMASEIAQARNDGVVMYEKGWGTETWGERVKETAKATWAKVTGEEYTPPKGRINVDSDLRRRANKVVMEDFSDAQLLDVATTPRENIGKYRLKADLGVSFDQGTYSNDPLKPAVEEGSPAAGPAKFSKGTQGGEVDVRDLNIRVTDEAISTAKDMLVDRIKGGKGEGTRLEVLRAGDSFTFNKGRTDGEGNSLEVKLQGKRLDSFKEIVANTDLAEQGSSERGSTWQKIKDMIKGRPIETGSEAIVRNLKNGVKTGLSDETKAESADVEEAAKEVKDAAARLKQKAGKLASSPDAVEGAQDEIKEAAGKVLDAAAKLEKAADRLSDPKIKMDAQNVAESARKMTDLAESDKFTPEGIGADARELKKAAGKLATIAQTIDSAGDVLAGSGSRLEASELSRQAIESVNAQMQSRIDGKLAEAQKLRNAGNVEGADALEREALSLKATRKSVEADAFLQFVNEQMGKDFTAYRSGRIGEAQINRSIDQFVDTWEKGVFGELWGTAVPDGEGGRKWTIPDAYKFTGRDGGMIPEFRGPQKAMLKEILKSMAEGNQMTMGLLKTSGGKTLLSFVLLSFMDTLARQKGKQGAVYVTVNGDLVAQAYEDYRAFFKGREPRFEIRTVSDFMADQAMADATGGMSPFKSHDVVFDEYDLLGTITALSLGSDNGRLSHPELDPVQKTLHQGVEELHDFFKRNETLIGKDIDGEKLTKMIQAKDTPFAKEFMALRDKYVNLVNEAISDVRGPVFGKGEFEKQLLDMSSPMYKDLGIANRDQFVNRFGMTPEQVYKEMRQEHDHAFGSGWRGLWDVGVIQRQQGGLEGYITKTFLGGIQAMSKPDIGKYYDAELDPTGKKLVQYHNDVPLDNLDTLYRSFLELKHGIPLTLDFDNLTVVDFAGLNKAAKESGATLVAVSGTLPKDLEGFMKDLGWNIMGEKAPGQALDYKTLDPVRKGVRDAIELMHEGRINEAMSRVDKMDIDPKGVGEVRDLLKNGKVEEAAAKLSEVAPGNSMYHEVITGVRELVDAAPKVKETVEAMRSGKVDKAVSLMTEMGIDRETRDDIAGLLRSDKEEVRDQAFTKLYDRVGRGGRNLGFFFAESKGEYKGFEAEMDALNPKFSGQEQTVARYNQLHAESVRLSDEMKRLRGDPNATAQLESLKEQYKQVESELDPLRMIPKKRRVLAVTPDSNFLVQEWLMPEAVEGKNIAALEKGEADVVILIGQSGFRGLDLPFKKAYVDGHISMFIADPGSLSTVNRRQLTGRIDTGRMPKGATSDIIGIVKESTVLESEAYKTISGKAIHELGSNGEKARWDALGSLLRDRFPGQTIDEKVVESYLKTPPPADDAEAAKTFSDVRYLFQDAMVLHELAKIVKPEEVQAALKDPAAAAKLASRKEVVELLLTQDAIQSIMTDLQAKEEYKSLEASGIFKTQQPGVLQQLLARLRGLSPSPAPAH